MSMSGFVLKAMAITLGCMAVVYCGLGLLLEDDWSVESSRRIDAEPERVGQLVGNFATWTRWSAIDCTLGPETQRAVSGEPGSVGQRIVWSGAQGQVSLAVTAVGPGFVEYGWELPGDWQGWQAKGRIEWAGDGKGCRVAWREDCHWSTLAGRWWAWFGAPQAGMKRRFSASLAGLEELLGGDGATPK